MRSILPARQLSPADAASLIDEYWVAPATSILEGGGSTHLSSYLILIFPCPIFFLSLLFLPSCSWNLSQRRQKFLRSNNCSNFPAVMTVGVLLSWFFLLFSSLSPFFLMKRLQRTMFLAVIYFACVSFSSCLTFTAQWCSKPEARRRRLELLLGGGGGEGGVQEKIY